MTSETTGPIRSALGVLFAEDSYDAWTTEDTARILIHVIDVETASFTTDETFGATRGVARVTPEGVQVVFAEDHDEDMCESALIDVLADGAYTIEWGNLDAEAVRAYRSEA